MGFFLGLFSSATFGLIPLFTLPLIHDGVSPASVLFYRFLIASLTLGGVLVLRRERFHASAIDLCKLAGMSFMYTAAALLLFYGLNYMPSGVATTIQFLYPVMVMLLMIAFFHEQFSMITACSIVLAVAGVALLSIGGDSSRPVTLLGVGMMLLSGFCNALYITGIHVAGIRNMNGLVMTFYVLFFGAAFAFANAVGTGTFQPLSSWWEFMMAALLAVITAVLSNLTLVLAVQRIGSTLTSVLGVMEPLTAVFVGILVFNEPFTPALVGGVKAGNAQGIRPGNTAVFKPEDSRGHLSFCSIHWLESWFPWSKRQWRRIQGGKRLAEAALSPTEPSSRSGNDPSLPEVDGDARGWNGLLPDVVSALLPAAAAFRRRYEWMMNVQKRHAGNSWERVMAHAS